MTRLICALFAAACLAALSAPNAEAGPRNAYSADSCRIDVERFNRGAALRPAVTPGVNARYELVARVVTATGETDLRLSGRTAVGVGRHRPVSSIFIQPDTAWRAHLRITGRNGVLMCESRTRGTTDPVWRNPGLQRKLNNRRG